MSNAGNFSCLCQAGKTGKLCEKDIEPCVSSPCKNGGLCVNEGADRFKCVCLTGFTGRLCEMNIDFCINPPLVKCEAAPCLSGCQNNATCLSNAVGFSCKCKPGFEGALCEKRIDFCKISK